MAETKQKRPRRKASTAPRGDAEPAVLDLRTLGEPRQRVLTTPGDFELRRISELGAIDRTTVTEALAAVERVSALIEGADVDTVAGLVDELEEHEDHILGLALVPKPTIKQLKEMPAPERAGVVAAFFGATTAQTLAAVAQIRSMRGPSIGARSRRGSSGSTAATRRRG